MLTAPTDGPTVALSFANNFWGKEDAGVGPLLERMQGAKQTCDELRSFYNTRASIEDDYARKLMSLCRKPLGSHEMGSLRVSLDVMRGEVESMAKQHQSIAAQMKSELEEPLAAFAGAMKERRKIVQNGIEKLHKIKTQQTQVVNKTRDRYEQECLKIKGYLAQGHMVMGQEERKNKAKLEKTQISLAATNTEYESAVKTLEETTARWNREWKAAADKFQDLEEERLDFTKSSLWSFANIASTVCVSDDASCEKIRLSLEKMEVEKDIYTFIVEKGTGQEIPDPPKYINFCRGDVDSQSEASDDDYSVAQFPRSINPAYRTSSPQPSTYESHHDPSHSLFINEQADANPSSSREPTLTPQKKAGSVQGTPQKKQIQQEQQLQLQEQQLQEQQLQQQQQQLEKQQQKQLQQKKQQQQQRQLEQRQMEQRQLEQRQMEQRQIEQRQIEQLQIEQRQIEQRQMEQRQIEQRQMEQQQQLEEQQKQLQLQQQQLQLQQKQQQQRQQQMLPPLEKQRALQQDAYGQMQPLQSSQPQKHSSASFDPNDFSAVPHDPYPMDGMTMLCRPGGQAPSELGSQLSSQVSSQVSSNSSSSARPSSRDSHSDYSIPTPYSSQELPSGKTSPVKNEPATPVDAMVPTDPSKLAKKKSGFFQNHSPFRRKSTKDMSGSAGMNSNRSSWHPSAGSNAPQQQSHGMQRASVYGGSVSGGGSSAVTNSAVIEPKNLLSDRTASPDPIAANASLALNIGQNVFPVTTPDRRAAAAAPAEPEDDPIAMALAELKGVTVGKQSTVRMSADHYHGIATPQPGLRNGNNSAVAAAMRGTPPPSYDQQLVHQQAVQRLGVPPQAVTAKAMKQTSQKFVDQTRSMFSPAAQAQAQAQAQQKAGGPGSVAGYGQTPARTATRSSYDMRATSPVPRRSVSPHPQPGQVQAPPQQQRQESRMGYRSASPNPYAAQQQQRPQQQQPQQQQSQHQRQPSQQSYHHTTGSMSSKRGSDQGYQSYRHQSPNDMSRAASPSPYRNDYGGSVSSNGGGRPGSSIGSYNGEMAMQLAPVGGDDGYGSQRGGGSRPGTSNSNSRAMGLYDGATGGALRPRSKSMADPNRQYTRDGRPIMHYARALYVYQAAIPEELGFNKGDILAVIRHQDDGWWEATVHNGSGQIGLVPSNYLQPC